MSQKQRDDNRGDSGNRPKSIFLDWRNILFLLLLSALFEWGLKPLVPWLIDKAVSGSSRFSTLCVDLIYRSVGRNPGLRLEVFTSDMFIYGALIYCVSRITKSWAEYREYKATLDRLEKHLAGEEPREPEVSPKALVAGMRKTKNSYYYSVVALSIVFGILILFGGFAMWLPIYRVEATEFVENSMDILAPHYSQQKIAEIRAQFRKVKAAKDFYLLEDEIRKLATDSKEELPYFKELGR